MQHDEINNSAYHPCFYIQQVRFVSEGNLFESNVATSLGGPGQAGPEGGAIFLSDITAANFKDDEFKNNSAITERPKGLSGVAGAIYIEVQV